jgi:hypothetical protein
MRQKRSAGVKASNAAMARGEWMPASKTRTQRPRSNDVRPQNVNLASRFGSLEIDLDEPTEKFVKPEAPVTTWAQVAKGIAKPTFSYESDDESELPPLNWGKANGARWADTA